MSFSPGDRVQVIDDSNEEWWKVGNKSFANVCMSALLSFCSVCVCTRVPLCIYMLIQAFKSSYYCVTPAPYLHVINMQATDRNRASFSLKVINFTNVSSTKGSLLTQLHLLLMEPVEISACVRVHVCMLEKRKVLLECKSRTDCLPVHI